METLAFSFVILSCMALIQLKQSDLVELRAKWANEQDYVCPIFKNKYDINDFVIDHEHALKHEMPDETGKGLCRGAIHRQANSIEGRMYRCFKRDGGDKHIDFISFLRNLADYLENNKIHSNEKLIHPTEKVKPPKLMKSSYNKLVKAVGGKQKVPQYTGKFTKALENLYTKYGIRPEFKKSSAAAKQTSE